MSPDKVEFTVPYEKLSPEERNTLLRTTLNALPRQLTAGEPQMVANLRYMNDLANLLLVSNGTQGSTRFILETASYASEFGLEAVTVRPEDFTPEDSFPEILFDTSDPEGLFGERPQLTEQRGLIFLSENRGAFRNIAKEYRLYTGWWAEYRIKYGHDPFENDEKNED